MGKILTRKRKTPLYDIEFFDTEEYDKEELKKFREDVLEFIKEKELNLMTSIKEGDCVKVVDSGFLYTSYVDWLLKNIDDKEILCRYAYGDSISENDFNNYKVEVVKIAPHGNKEEGDLALIRLLYDDWGTGCYYYLINVKGLIKA